ncbi:hypothetical protein C8Q80DRAFT_438288 [Daedaleopsis nitida]|nr:hypothetical protein C8Q80DRAFT_438288 [Daedaleopsis nitida]
MLLCTAFICSSTLVTSICPTICARNELPAGLVCPQQSYRILRVDGYLVPWPFLPDVQERSIDRMPAHQSNLGKNKEENGPRSRDGELAT